MQELAQRWVSYAVGIALGRFARGALENLNNGDGLMVVHQDHPDDLAQRVIDILAAVHTDTEASSIVRTAIGGSGDLRDASSHLSSRPLFQGSREALPQTPCLLAIAIADAAASAFTYSMNVRLTKP